MFTYFEYAANFLLTSIRLSDIFEQNPEWLASGNYKRRLSDKVLHERHLNDVNSQNNFFNRVVKYNTSISKRQGFRKKPLSNIAKFKIVQRSFLNDESK